jgi:ferritin-like metal-binding protein YciE
MKQNSRAELFAELQERVRASRKNTEESVRNLNEVFYSAEREKQQIASYYRLRRLQRLSRSHAM